MVSKRRGQAHFFLYANVKGHKESKAYTAKVLGYDIDWQASLIIMNYAWGSKEQVRHVGVAVEQLIPSLPEHKTGQVLLSAHLHEVRQLWFSLCTWLNTAGPVL